MRPVVLTEEAEADIAEAADWYEGQTAGLGKEFLRALRVVWIALGEHPEMYPAGAKN